MRSYIVRRIVQAIVVTLLVTLFTFVMFHSLPGGPARAILGRRASAPQLAAFTKENGLDRPLLVQYGDYVWRLLHGNLGFSYKLNQSVWSILEQSIPKSVVLVGVSTVLALLVGSVTGLYQAVRRNSIEDHALTGAAFIFYSMPDFFLGLVLIDLFAIRLHIFSTEGPQGSWTEAFTQPSAMALPITTLTLTSIAIFSRYVRASALDVFGQDYIRVVRAKGASRGRVLWFHTIRNAGLSIVTLLGLSLPGLFSGALIVEEVFNYPGIGFQTFNAAYNRDYPIELAVTVIVGLTTVIGNLLADLAYAAIDPRVRLQ